MADHFIQTFTGKRVNPIKMTPDDVDIRDIAHALALTNRFTGHTPEPYSVAQHSVLVANLCKPGGFYADPNLHLWALLHDSGEAYLADISRPVKMAFMEQVGPFLKEVESGIMKAVCGKFGLSIQEPPEVKKADDDALANEAYSFFGETDSYKHWHHQFSNGYKQMPFMIKPQPWRRSEFNFLAMYTEFQNQRNMS